MGNFSRTTFTLLAVGAAGCVQAGSVAPFLGRWDVTLTAPEREYPTWLEISRSDSQLQVRMVGRWGHARVLPQAEFLGDRIRFVSPKEEEGRNDDMVFEARLERDVLVGETRGPDGSVWKLRGERAPALTRAAAPAWGKSITLFNGRDLTGWHTGDGKPPCTWSVEGGTLVSHGRGTELVTDRQFEDFKLHVEFRVAAGANSGVYLRGRYEVQVEHDVHPEAPDRGLGGVYGFLAPTPMPARLPDTWRSYDITLIGRRVTVVLDGVMLIDDQEIPGITGGALDSREGAPGPVYLQGSESGRVAFRNIVLTPTEPARPRTR